MICKKQPLLLMMLRAMVFRFFTCNKATHAFNIYAHQRNNNIFKTTAQTRRNFSTALSSMAQSSSSSVENQVIPDISTDQMEAKSRILADDDVYEKTKSTLDKRKYRLIELRENKLQALLVSDSETDTEAAAVHVRAGHFDDPDDRAGLAHFHEHMVFLGSEKYPNEGEFESFLSQQGGAANAYTDMQDTNYYFYLTPSFEDKSDINGKVKVSESLDKALDRFAQFFICPKFDENAVERELRAIDSEFSNSIMSDSWRNYQILKSSCDENHPFRKFGCGNYETLTSSPRCSARDDLLKFWDEKYHAGNVRVCVLGRGALDELQDLVETHFAGVRHGELTSVIDANNDSKSKAFTNKQLSIIREIKPCKAGQKISFMFNVPPTCVDESKSCVRPHRVISHLIGHEGNGSLHQILNDEGLIYGLSSGMGVDTSDFGLFSVTLRLTKKGIQQRDHVTALFWQWINLIKTFTESNDLAAYHEELRALSSIAYRFKENGNPVDFCSAMSENMFYYSPQELINAAYKTGDYDHEVVCKFINRLIPNNSMVHVWDSNFETNSEWKIEKWYKGEYNEIMMSSEDLDIWTNSLPDHDVRLEIPKLNAYIPDDFTLKSPLERIVHPTQYPTKLVENERFRFWHKIDDGKYCVPKTYLHMHVTSPAVYASPRTMTQARLFERMLKDLLSCEFYDACLAGISYGVGIGVTGVNFRVSGYSQKTPLLTATLFERIKCLIDNLEDGKDHSLIEKYSKALESLHRETSNFNLDPPYEVANYNSRLLLEQSTWTIPQYLREMNSLMRMNTVEAMAECGHVIRDALFDKVCRVEALCMGNLNEDDAKNDFADVIQRHFIDCSEGLGDEEVPRFRSMKLPTRAELAEITKTPNVNFPLIHEDLAKGSSENNNAIELHIQVGSESYLKYKGVAILDLIGHMAYTSAFQTLRTEQQLGYIVSAYPRSVTGGAHGISIVVQSSSKAPEELERHCEEWLVKFRGELENMTEDEIKAEASAVVSQLLERDTRLSQEVSRMWGQIATTEPLSPRDREPVFDRLEKLANTINVESKDESQLSASELKVAILEMFDDHLLATSSNRRALSCRVYGQSSKSLFDENTGKPGILQGYDDIMRIKLGLETFPIRPYWK